MPSVQVAHDASQAVKINGDWLYRLEATQEHIEVKDFNRYTKSLLNVNIKLDYSWTHLKRRRCSFWFFV